MVQIYTFKALFQYRAVDTAINQVYTCPALTTCFLKNIIICNTTASATSYSFYIDIDGTTYDVNSAIAVEHPIAAYQTFLWEAPTGAVLLYEAGGVAVKAGVANALTFTGNGAERTN